MNTQLSFPKGKEIFLDRINIKMISYQIYIFKSRCGTQQAMRRIDVPEEELRFPGSEMLFALLRIPGNQQLRHQTVQCLFPWWMKANVFLARERS